MGLKVQYKWTKETIFRTLYNDFNHFTVEKRLLFNKSLALKLSIDDDDDET